MKRILTVVSVVAVLLTLFAPVAGAQTWKAGLSASYPGVSFNDVQYLNATTAWTVGSKGTVLKSTDAGATWTGAAIDTLGTLTSVYFRTTTDGYIGSSSRKLYKTTNGGSTWTRILLNDFLADTGAVVRAVYFADASKGWILTSLNSANGRILRTTDGGATWTQDLVVAANNMIDMDFSGPDRGVAVGKSTATLYYTKNGTTWTVAPTPTLTGATYTRSDIRGVTMVDSLLGYAVGWGSLVGAQASIQLKTTNGGESWTHMVQDNANRMYDNLYGVHFKNAANGLCVGGASRGSIAARTVDSGKTWTPIDLPSGVTLNNIAGQGDAVTVTGSSGVIFVSTDFGTTWDLKSGMPGSTIYGLQFPTATNGFGAGFDGLFIKTTNSGNAWKASFAYANKLSPNFNDVHFVNGTTGLAVGSYRIALKTTNAGSSWTQVIPDTTAATVTHYGAFMVNENLAFVVGQLSSTNGVVYKTTDGGTTWTTKSAVVAKALRGVAFGSTTVGAVVGAGRVAAYTTDGGATWSAATFNNVPAARSVSTLRKVTFLNATTAIAVGDTIILKSTDGGANWNYVTSPASIALNGLAFQNATTGYAAGKQQVLKTTDGGDTWTAVTDPTLHIDAQNAVAIDGAGNPWVSGASGFLSTTATLSAVGTDNVLPARFALDQNYPNPFNPSTSVRFTLPQAAKVGLVIYNMLGQRVAAPINGTMFEAGSHTVQFDASGLATGVYLYRLTAGSFTETRKMVLVR
jgi:photosystem II stability/assembly factor-like uncharacterized protein